MKLLIHFNNSTVQLLKFGNGLVISNLGSSSRSTGITIITIADSNKIRVKINDSPVIDMEHIKTGNDILKLMVKTKSH